jgi:hypothetical protein
VSEQRRSGGKVQGASEGGAGGKDGLRSRQEGTGARTSSGPEPRRAEAGQALTTGISTLAAPARPGSPRVALPRAGADFDRIPARGQWPKSWGGHTRVSCGRAGPVKLKPRAGVTFIMQWWGATATIPAPGCQGSVSRKTLSPPGRAGAGRARGGLLPLAP